jgi:hypothetical protein
MKTIYKAKKIIIIGFPGTGKTTLFNEIADDGMFKDHLKIHCDEYIEKYGYVPALYELIKVLKTPYLIEGTLGFRLLRKIMQNSLNEILPDVVIVRGATGLQAHTPQEKGLRTILYEASGLGLHAMVDIIYWDMNEDTPLLSLDSELDLS